MIDLINDLLSACDTAKQLSYGDGLKAISQETLVISHTNRGYSTYLQSTITATTTGLPTVVEIRQRAKGLSPVLQEALEQSIHKLRRQLINIK